MGSGNFDVGKTSLPRKPGQPPIETPAAIDTSNPRKTERPRICGAMTQQCGDSGRGNESAPQKFVRLVGFRETNARPEPWVRPRPLP